MVTVSLATTVTKHIMLTCVKQNTAESSIVIRDIPLTASSTEALEGVSLETTVHTDTQ